MPRKLTLLPLVAAIYFMVFGGPYGLEDIVARSGYAGAIAILLLTPLLWALPTGLMVAEMTSAVPEEGGYYVYVTRGLGRFWGFQEVWLSLAGSIFDMAIYPTLFIGYLGHFLPAATAGARGMAIGVALVAAAALWNALGARKVGGSSVLLGIVLLAPFAVLMAVGALHRAPATAPVPLRQADILGGILVAMWNFMGWDNSSTVAGEVENPRRTYPLAMVFGILAVTVTAILPIAAVALTGLDPNRWSTGGWAVVAQAIGGGTLLAFAITAGGMIGAAGSLNALTLSLSRLPAVLAEDRFLPRIFARRNAAGAPWFSIGACALLWALALQLTFVKLIALDVLLTGLSILLQFAALVGLRVREPGLKRPYRVPGGIWGAIGIGIPPLVLLILTALRTQIEPVGPINALDLGALLIAGGVGAYFLGRTNRAGISNASDNIGS
ncbi:MAG TPA: APC family permease [Bryobacteraceae bacterium]|nr:APC family permease [Bryobacteraceae bacterium]